MSNNQKPKKPRDNAGAGAWEAYWRAMEAWQAGRDYERQVRQEQRREAKRHARPGAVAKAVVTGALTVHGALAQPQQQSDTAQHNWAGTSAQSEGDRRARDMRDGTRDKRNHDSGSSQW